MCMMSLNQQQNQKSIHLLFILNILSLMETMINLSTLETLSTYVNIKSLNNWINFQYHPNHHWETTRLWSVISHIYKDAVLINYKFRINKDYKVELSKRKKSFLPWQVYKPSLSLSLHSLIPPRLETNFSHLFPLHLPRASHSITISHSIFLQYNMQYHI